MAENTEPPSPAGEETAEDDATTASLSKKGSKKNIFSRASHKVHKRASAMLAKMTAPKADQTKDENTEEATTQTEEQKLAAVIADFDSSLDLGNGKAVADANLEKKSDKLVKQVSFRLPAQEVSAHETDADAALKAILEQFNASLDIGLEKAKATRADNDEAPAPSTADVLAMFNASLDVGLSKAKATEEELVAENVEEVAETAPAPSTADVLAMFNASLDVGLSKAKGEREEKEEDVETHPSPTLDDVAAMFSASLDVGLESHKAQVCAEAVAPAEVEEVLRSTEGFASRSTVARPEVSVNAASEAADALREAAIGAAMIVASEVSAAVIQEAIEKVDREQALPKDAAAVAREETAQQYLQRMEGAAVEGEGEGEGKGETLLQSEAGQVEEDEAAGTQEAERKETVVEQQLTKYAPTGFWPTELSVAVATVDSEDHPLYEVVVSSAGEVIEGAGCTHRFAAFRDLKNEVAKSDTHKANTGFPRTFLRNKIGVALTPVQQVERAEKLQSWFNAMVRAELPLEAAEALAAFLQVDSEASVKEKGEEQGLKAEGPYTPTSPLEAKLSTAEQAEADRRSSLAQ